MKAKLKSLSFDFENQKQILTIVVDGDFRRQYDQYKDVEIELDIKKYREKRSKTANAYCWELLGKLSEMMNLPAEELYRNAIKAVGIYRDFPPLPKKEANTLKQAWKNNGLGWIAEQLDYDQDGNSVIIRCWYGSSSYNTKQMARLLDYIIQDCHALGIETRPQEEIDSLLSKWKGANV